MTRSSPNFLKKLAPAMQVVMLLAIFGTVLVDALSAGPVYAAALTASRDHMNTSLQSQSSGISHTVSFTTSAVDGTENKVSLRFPLADNGLWCRTADTLTVAGSSEDGATPLPSGTTLAATCTEGDGASTFDTITISNVSNLTISTRYGFVVSDGTGALGTPTTASTGIVRVATLTAASAVIDSQNIAVSITTAANTNIAVTASVDPSISATLTTNAANLGTLTASNVSKAEVDSTVTTNALNGFTSYVYYDHKLRIDVSNDVNDTTGGTIVAGTEEFGVSTDEASGVDIGVWSPASCATGASTSNATAVTTSPQSFGIAAAPVSADVTSLCIEASVTATTTAGSYSNTLTVVTTGKF